MVDKASQAFGTKRVPAARDDAWSVSSLIVLVVANWAGRLGSRHFNSFKFSSENCLYFFLLF